ncbi:MAG: hypothetical protein KBG54_03175 [Oscillospiraceae bacterium]|nr:hypothetical protein [Oscillospiraceae bacterium]
MMRKYWALVRVNFRGLIANFAGSNNTGKKRAATGIGALCLMAFLGLYLSCVYSIMLGSMLRDSGMIALMPVIMALATTMMSMLFTAFAATGIVFGNKDSDLMLSLPLSAFAVMLSKIMALYLENLFFSIFMMLPAGVAYLVMGGEGGVGFVLRYLLCNIFLPILPTFFSLIIGFILSFVQAKFGRHALVQNILYLVFFALIMVFSLRLNTMAASLLQNAPMIWNVFSTWLFPLGLFRDAIYGNYAAMLGFIALMCAPFIAVVYLFSTRYKKMLTILSSTKTRNDYRMTDLKTSGQLSALLRKEFGRYFGTPIYVFNTGIGVVMALGAAGFAVFKKADVAMLLVQLEGAGMSGVLMLLVLAASFMCVMTCSACVSISLEGKTLWILKEAPIATKTILLAKASVNIALIWTIAFVAAPLCWYAFSLPLLQGLALVFLCFAFGPFVAFSGLLINLFFPKMDAANDTLVVKQSTAALLGVFGGFGAMGIGALLYWLLSDYVSDVAFVFASALVLLLCSWVLWVFTKKRGEKMLQQL